MSKKPRVVEIIQARMGASRLPGKPLLEVMGRPLLSYQIERLKRCQKIDEIVIATTLHPRDEAIVDFCHSEKIPFFRGSEEDVLDRYYQAAKEFSADVIVRGTADCPLSDPGVVDDVVAFFLDHYPSYDYVSNILSRTFPRGIDVEVFSMKSLNEAQNEAKKPEEREHVTPFLYRHPERFKLANIVRSPDESQHRWTVDTSEDFELISLILKDLYPKKSDFNLQDILEAFQAHPQWFTINSHIEQKKM